MLEIRAETVGAFRERTEIVGVISEIRASKIVLREAPETGTVEPDRECGGWLCVVKENGFGVFGRAPAVAKRMVNGPVGNSFRNG